MEELEPTDEFKDPLQNYEPKQYDDALEEAIAEEPISQIHHSPHASILPDASIEEAVTQLAGQHIACLLVEENRKLLGVLTDRDVLNKVALEPSVLSRPVREIMIENPVFVYDDDPVAAALCVMAVCGHRHVPVVNVKEEVVGVVSPQRVTEFLSNYF